MPVYDQLINESLPGASQAVRAVTTIVGAQYPRVYADGRAIFRVRLPQAKTVHLEGGQGLCSRATPLHSDGHGNWSATIAPAVTGFHYYWFNVDGTIVNDPGSESFFAHGRQTSGIEIPDPQLVSSDLVTTAVVPFYGPHEGPQGQLREHRYHSGTTGQWRRCIVYTPPGYDDELNRSLRYPVLYLQHEAGEDETAWSRQGGVQFIMDNLIKGAAVDPFGALFGATARKLGPMIVVMDNGVATSPATSAGSADPFVAVLTNELLPSIESTFRTLPDRDHRAVAGVATGAVQMFAAAQSRPNLFSEVGLFSAPRLKAARNPPRRIWLGAGTAEAEFREALQANAASLRSRQVRCVEYLAAGTAHEWQTWRTCLREFVPRLFQA